MERTANIDLAAWRADGASLVGNRQLSLRVFAGTLIAVCLFFGAVCELVAPPVFRRHCFSFCRAPQLV